MGTVGSHVLTPHTARVVVTISNRIWYSVPRYSNLVAKWVTWHGEELVRSAGEMGIAEETSDVVVGRDLAMPWVR